MEQKVPDFDLVPHEGDMICTKCGETVDFLIGIVEEENEEDHRKCRDCMAEIRPQYAQAISDFAELLALMLKAKEKFMTEDLMHELYGNKGDTEE